MELLQLKYFLAVAKSQQLSKTAQEFFVTPSAVSTSISRLEDELGVELFDRVGRNIRLNAYGQIYARHIADVFDTLESARSEIQQFQQRSRNHVSVSVMNPILWGGAITHFHSLHPEIAVRLSPFEGQNKSVFPPPSNADFVIASPSAFHPRGWECEIILDDPVLLAVPPGHRFAGRRSLDLAEARDEWFISLLPDYSFRQYCDELCIQAGFTPRSKFECDYTMRPRMLPGHDMVCLTTRLAQLSGVFRDAVFIPISSPPCHRAQAIFWKKSRRLSDAPLLFKSFLLEYYQNYSTNLPPSC